MSDDDNKRDELIFPSEINFASKQNQDGYVCTEGLALLLQMTQETLKNQFDGHRVLLARCYVVMGQASGLAALALGAAVAAFGAINTPGGWAGHWSIVIGLASTGLLWFTSAMLSLSAVLPQQAPGVAIHTQDFVSSHYLNNDARALQIGFLRVFHRSIQVNARGLPETRRKLDLALKLLAFAPICGPCATIVLRVARLAVFG